MVWCGVVVRSDGGQGLSRAVASAESSVSAVLPRVKFHITVQYAFQLRVSCFSTLVNNIDLCGLDAGRWR